MDCKRERTLTVREGKHKQRERAQTARGRESMASRRETETEH